MGFEINSFSMSGNLVRNGEYKILSSGTPCIEFSICCNTSKKDPNGNWEDVPNYFDCVHIGKHAEFIAPLMVKGCKVVIQGSLKQDRWQDKQSGQGRSKVKLNCKHCLPIPKVQNNNNAMQPVANAQPMQPVAGAQQLFGQGGTQYNTPAQAVANQFNGEIAPPLTDADCPF